MPQLDTSTWFIIILSTILTLFILFQLKMSKYNYPLSPSIKSFKNNKTKQNKTKKQETPWKQKWTKTFLSLSLPQHY